MGAEKPVSVLFVCLGNICRSPTAHGVFQTLVDRHQLQQQIVVDSAGTGDWHIGHAPDQRTMSAASLRGYDLSELRARQVGAADFAQFDYILAMDSQNLRDLQRMQPPHFSGVLDLFLPYGDVLLSNSRNTPREVPDPYYGGVDGFETVLDLVENAAQGLLQTLAQRHQLSLSR